MPRKSVESHLTVVPTADAVAVTRIARVRPPPGLSDAVAREFQAIANACAAEHFRPSDCVLLASYAELAVMARSPDLSLDDFVKIARTQALLATRLRLAPSTRSNHRSAARQRPTRGRDWEAELDD